MEDLSNKYFLMIEPDKYANPSPIPSDSILVPMTKAIFSVAKRGLSYIGHRTTRHGVHESGTEYILPNGMITHNLCVYYVERFFDVIPDSEKQKIIDVFVQIFGDYISLNL